MIILFFILFFSFIHVQELPEGNCEDFEGLPCPLFSIGDKFCCNVNGDRTGYMECTSGTILNDFEYDSANSDHCPYGCYTEDTASPFGIECLGEGEIGGVCLSSPPYCVTDMTVSVVECEDVSNTITGVEVCNDTCVDDIGLCNGTTWVVQVSSSSSSSVSSSSDENDDDNEVGDMFEDPVHPKNLTATIFLTIFLILLLCGTLFGLIYCIILFVKNEKAYKKTLKLNE